MLRTTKPIAQLCCSRILGDISVGMAAIGGCELVQAHLKINLLYSDRLPLTSHLEVAAIGCPMLVTTKMRRNLRFAQSLLREDAPKVTSWFDSILSKPPAR